MLRKVLAGIAGFIACFATIMLSQAAGHAALPPPADIDLSDPTIASDYIATLPPWMLGTVLLGYFAGAFVGPFVAKWLGGGNGRPYVYLFAGFVLGGTLLTVYQIPHPAWFVVVAVVGIPLSAWYGAKLGPRRVASPEVSAE